MSLPTINTYFFSSCVVPFRTILPASSIKDEWVVWAVRALRSKEKDVLEGDVAEEGCADIKIKDKLAS